MELGTTLFLIAAGAILRWAVTIHSANVHCRASPDPADHRRSRACFCRCFWMIAAADRRRSTTPIEAVPGSSYDAPQPL